MECNCVWCLKAWPTRTPKIPTGRLSAAPKEERSITVPINCAEAFIFFFSMHLKCNKNLCLRSRALIVANMCNLWISLPTKHSPSPNCIDDDAGLFASQFKISKAEKRRKQRCEPIDKMSARSTWQRDANGNHRDAMLAESALVLELFSLFIFSAFLVDAVCQTKSPKCG